MKTVKIFPLLSLLLFLLSCGSTRITSSWSADNAGKEQHHKIIVIGIINEKDRQLRTLMESRLVDNLKDHGYDAVSAMEQYGPNAFKKLSEDEIVSRLSSSGYNAVLTIVLLNKQKEQNYVPGTVNYVPVGAYYHRFWGYYSTIYDRVYMPGYYDVSTQYFWESNFYDVKSSELIYSVQTKAFDPSSSESLAQEYGNKIVKDMAKKKVI
ncbi:hypothetical protein [Ferruginibacter albus]|uniref:hypothetical protein n=1 Tax=Ferruginibacter albus TaxID=2875540 RepID=UPI001CC77CB7|nr:hypothetical protein [Ferruginibacter albus]UAY53321.1 hypothetical protein K9M53_06535 [Ferruginibacter albus]